MVELRFDTIIKSLEFSITQFKIIINPHQVINLRFNSLKYFFEALTDKIKKLRIKKNKNDNQIIFLRSLRINL